MHTFRKKIMWKPQIFSCIQDHFYKIFFENAFCFWIKVPSGADVWVFPGCICTSTTWFSLWRHPLIQRKDTFHSVKKVWRTQWYTMCNNPVLILCPTTYSTHIPVSAITHCTVRHFMGKIKTKKPNINRSLSCC